MTENRFESGIRAAADECLSGLDNLPSQEKEILQKIQESRKDARGLNRGERLIRQTAKSTKSAGRRFSFRTAVAAICLLIAAGGALALRNPTFFSGLFQPADLVSEQATTAPVFDGAAQTEGERSGNPMSEAVTPDVLDRIDLTADPDQLWNEDYGILAEGAQIDKSALPFQNATYRKLSLNSIEGEMTYTWADERKGSFKCRVLMSLGGNGYEVDLPQKSLQLFLNGTREIISSGSRTFLLFEDRNYDYSSVLLWNAGMDGVYTRLADGVQSRLIENHSGLKILTLAWKPVTVWLNGEYWGQYNMREVMDAETICRYEGISSANENEIIIVEGLSGNGDPTDAGNLIYRNLIEKLKHSDPARNAEDREYLEQNIDVDSYLSWLALKAYFGDSNAAANFVTYRLPNRKWKCAAAGFDWGLFRADYNAIKSFLKPEGFGAIKADNTVFLKILEIDEYRELFLKKLGGLYQQLTTEVMQAELDQCAALLEPEMPRHFERWAAYSEPTINPETPTDPEEAFAYWKERIDRMRIGTMKKRPWYVYLQTQEFFGLSNQEMDQYFSIQTSSGNEDADAAENQSDRLVITQEGAASCYEMTYTDIHPETELTVRRVDDCSPGWVAQQIESRSTDSDLYVIRTGMTGYMDLLRKGFCADLNDIDSISSRLKQMVPAVIDTVSYQGKLYAVPEMVILQSSCLLCDPSHPLWSRYHLDEHHSVSDILNMMKDLEEKQELDEWWFWSDHADAGHLYNLCVAGSVTYMETEESEINLEQAEYKELFSSFDQIRQSLLNRIEPPSTKDPLFYTINYVDETLLSNENLTPVLITPMSGQNEVLQLGLQVFVLNPYAPNKEKAVKYLNDILDSYSPLQSLYLYPQDAEPVKDPYEEITGTRWILSPDLISWYKENTEKIRVPLKGLMDLFWDNQGLEMERRYLDGNISINQYIGYLNNKLGMLNQEIK